MKNLFSSPRATRLFIAVLVICSWTLYFNAVLLWPDDAADPPSIIGKLFVLAVFSSVFLWQAYKYWKAWHVEYKYGLRLSKTDRNTQVVAQAAATDRAQFLRSTKTTLELIDRPEKESLRFPWPSLACACLMFLTPFLGLDLSPSWRLFAWVAACIFVSLPYFRWSNLFGSETKSFEAMEAADNGLLPLDKHLIQINDSNFYRLHKTKLTKLGFLPLGQQRYRHFFSDPTGQVIAILGRDSLSETLAAVYLSLVSIDEQGCMMESSSLDRPYIKKWADCHEQWTFQTLNVRDVETALQRHLNFATTESNSAQFVAAKHYPTFAEYMHDVTCAAKIRHFNQYRVAIA